MYLFRKLGTEVSRQNTHFPSTFLSLLGKVILFLVLFSSFPDFNHGLCGENSGPGINEIKTDNSANKTESDVNIGAWLVSSVWKHISAVDGNRCPSDPSCSSYSAQAFKKHGFFVGWAMTVDRLIHEGDERSVSPIVRRNGRFKILDPVENNDFWWYSKDGQD
jgi:putative component of membrane protein insertase Oxa1/YidC/SpoIIIJ protein YidD